MKSRLSKSSFNLRLNNQSNNFQNFNPIDSFDENDSYTSSVLNGNNKKFNSEIKYKADDENNFTSLINLSKLNSKSVVNLNGVNRQVTKRKNSVNFKQILFDRLLNSSVNNKTTTSINKNLNKLREKERKNETPSNIDDFFEYTSDKLPIVNNRQLELKLNQIRKEKTQSIYDLRRNQAFNKLKTSNKQIKDQKKILNSKSLNDLSDLNMSELDKNDYDWKDFGSAYQNEIQERRLHHYITEIELDNILQTGSTLRAIYDGDEYNKFMERLDLRIKNHDKDIERMCNAHYQGFVDCIHDLLKVRPQAEQLKKGIIEINNETQKSSENVQKKAEELIKYRRILSNTEKAIENLKICLPVLDMFSKLLSQMDEKKYYPALKTLEQLETEFLPQVPKYKFAQSISIRIPKMRKEIQDASMKDLKDFLETIRKFSIKMGEIAMKNAALQQNIDDDDLLNSNQNSIHSSPSSPSSNSINETNGNNLLSRKSITNTSGKLRKRKAPLPPSQSMNSVDFIDKYSSSSNEDETSATDIVDFSPVYRCLHIYGCLGAREDFEQYYRQQRQQQAKLALQAPINMHETIEGYKNYFCGIVGFFVIEDHILTTGNGLVTKEYLDTIWNNSLQSIIASLRTHTSYCTDAKLMLKIKKIVILFIHTLQSYGYDVNQLFNLLLEIRDQYNEILMKQWVTVFRDIFQSDNYHPMVVHNLKELNDLLMEFPFYAIEAMNNNAKNLSLGINSLNDSSNNLNNISNDSSSEKYEKKFPFSSFVPKIFRKVKEFIHACLEFSHDLNTSQAEIEDMIRKSTNLLLTRTLSGCLSALIKKPNLGLLQLIQIAINTNYLEEASVYLEEYITMTIGENYNNFPSNSLINNSKNLKNDTSNQHLFRLQGKSMFKGARADAESQIYNQLNQKIDEFFELATYDWLMGESNGIASSYISDLIAFLRSTFEAFTNLPLNVAQTACHLACKYIAHSLMSLLMDEEVKSISLGAISQFNLDLLQSEMFAGSQPVKGFEEGDLVICFAELRQLINLFMDWDWATYFADFRKQNSKYLRVKPNTALILLEKVKEAEKKKNLLVSFKKNERDKKKLTDYVIRNLKQLINEN